MVREDSHIGMPCFWQVIFSMADEYVPDYVDKKALVER